MDRRWFPEHLRAKVLLGIGSVQQSSGARAGLRPRSLSLYDPQLLHLFEGIVTYINIILIIFNPLLYLQKVSLGPPHFSFILLLSGVSHLRETMQYLTFCVTYFT